MKLSIVIFTLLGWSVAGTKTNPIAKVIEMISGLQQEVIKEGTDAQKVYNEVAEMCEDRSQELHHEIKTGKATVEELTSAIEKAAADITVHEEDINGHAESVADAESDLKKATSIRKKENADFQAEEKELMATINTIERATRIIEREMNKGASLAQVSGLSSVTEALSAMVEAQAVSSADGAKLMSLVQSSSDSDEEDDDQEPGAPSAAAYENQSGGVVETLEGLLAKAESQLEDIRKTETDAEHAYQMQRQSLEDKIKFADKELAESKKALAESNEEKATAEGDLDVTKKDLAEDEKSLNELHHQCMSEATNFEEATKSRNEELKALAVAKKVIEESTGGASKQTYDLAQTSFVQVSAKSSKTAHAVNIVRRLAMTMRSKSLAQFARRLQLTSTRSSSEDVFAKVKGLITDMIEKLVEEAGKDATQKAFCDKEMAETEAKIDDKEDDIEKLSTRIDVMSAESKKLKEEVAVLQAELGELARTQAEMDKLRAEEKAAYEKNKPEMEQGLAGVKTALKVLREYYAKDDKSHDAAEGAGSGIIGLLEVCESDFSKGLAEMVAAEEAAVGKYEEATKENEVTRATKEQDATYKKKEFVALDKAIAEATSDKEGVTEELSAVNEYYAKLKGQCIAKPESYEQRKEQREREITGLKEALQTLDGDTSFLQHRSQGTLRGSVSLQPDA